MRKAFSLIEVIFVVGTLSIFMILVSPVFMLFARDIPRSTELVLEQTTVQQALDRIQQDVDEARALPRSYGRWSSDANTLLLDKEDEGMVLYRFANGKMTRTIVGSDEGPADPVGEWALPNASIRWGLWGQDPHFYGVEVHSHLIYRLRSKSQERLANTRVFFLVHAPREVTP